MNRFASLIKALSGQRGQTEKQRILNDYLQSEQEEEKLWTIALLSGKRPKRIIGSTFLKTWCIEKSGLPEWLFEESYQSVGDLAETIALILDRQQPSQQSPSLSLQELMHTFIRLNEADEQEKKKWVLYHWDTLNKTECFVFNKLITGGFRIGFSEKNVAAVLSKLLDKPVSNIIHRLSGNWSPLHTTWSELLLQDSFAPSQPYPFYLCYALEEVQATLAAPEEWIAEWKWDGIRGQIIKRAGEVFIWSRGEELITHSFPELEKAATRLPDGTVLDGEIICLKQSEPALTPLPFSHLQKRIGRKKPGKKLVEEYAVSFIVYDLLEVDGEDIRMQPLTARKEKLNTLLSKFSAHLFHLSPSLTFNNFEALNQLRENARINRTEGLMLKQKNSVYLAARKKGYWWKWKLDPMTIDCVLIYAQRGHGRRSGLYTDYTFAVRKGDQLVTIAKAYSGLTNEEIKQVDAFIKKESVEKFGPVRTVKPQLVFELSFEAIDLSSRHKSGFALRFPRISRWRKDKQVDEINTLEDLQAMIHK